MQALFLFCMFFGALSVEGEVLNELSSLTTFSSETDVSSSQHQPVDSSSTPNEKRTSKAQRTKQVSDTAKGTQSARGRTEAVWVELNAVLERWGGATGKLDAILRQLKEEKKHLLDKGKEQKAKRKEEDEDEEEDDDDDDEEDEEEEDDDDDDDDDDEEVKKEKEEVGRKEEEAGEEENDAPNRTSSQDSLPEGCKLAGSRISCKQIGFSHLPVITNQEVTILELPGNNLTRITPSGFSELPKLEELDLSLNKLEDSSFGQRLFMNLTKLKSLKLDDNALTAIPRLPSSLEDLKINNNKINQLATHSFKGLSNLKVLELAGNILYGGSIEPLAFKPLKALKFLRLDKNRFSAIPADLPPSIEVLRLQDNQIVEVQDKLLDKCVHLKVLDLSHNLLKENSFYPEAWINLPKLETLDLSHNQMAVVPSDLPRALRKLSLQHNHIHYIPPYSLSHLRPGLQSLRLSHNLLEEHGVLGKSFRGVYQSLVELHLDNNRLERVPHNMCHFKNLKLLHLDHNRISSVPVKSICKFKGTEESSLSTVHLEYNYINVKKIPRAAFSCIQDSSGIILEPQRQTQGY
ncbi:extracellular matrix protein 2 [Carassius gibelio]|uniref:extracellular matrix protein 2 n=1 Tax=Carassius gibelio TaxID=101364 RepID=UPI00227757F9|nr:extracellular matrix protein 2 [Carassius gibelio]